MLDRMFLGAAADDKLFVEDVFSTYLYTGNGSTQTITNGIDLAGKGGLAWLKGRSSAAGHCLYDTARGSGKVIASNTPNSQETAPAGQDLSSFNSNGFSLGPDYNVSQNSSGVSYASWTFREAPKFFDVVTYTGNDTSRSIAHNLGVAPGMVIVKQTNATADWQVYHRSTGNTQYTVLNSTAAAATGATRWNNTTPTATEFTVGTDATVNASGGTYVAYLYAHDTASTGLIQCGSYTGNGSATGPIIDLGWEPQWLLIKNASSAGRNWLLFDNMRGMVVDSADAYLVPNAADAEASFNYLSPTATGFQITATDGSVNNNGQTFIYIAIRRGPMRTPTLGTSVYTATRPNSSTTYTTGFPVDFSLVKGTAGDGAYAADRLRGGSKYLVTSGTAAEQTFGGWFFANNTGIRQDMSQPSVNWNFRRAPGFMDVVCYTGTGGSDVKPHNLGVVPELMIFKRRNSSGGWLATSNFTATTHRWGYLNTTAAMEESSYSFANILFAAPTATGFTLRTAGENNASGGTYVAYLFASAPGVSKVGSYTGNGSSQTINCGFAAGARFVMIKRTDAAGDWFVWDSARGIVAGNDPYLALNSTAAEVTTDDSVDTDSSGFVVNQVAATNVNVNAATYIYLAIA